MDVRDHFKNGASSKSQMSRGNKKWMFVFLAVVLTAGYAQAQTKTSIGARAGLNLTNMYFKPKPQDVDAFQMKPGFQIGVVSKRTDDDKFFLQAGVLIASQGYKTETNHQLNLTYLQLIPIKGLYKIDIGAIALMPSVGGYMGLGLTGKYTDEDGLKKKMTFGVDEDSNLNILDAGLGLGIGLLFNNIQVELGYNLGLVNIATTKGVKMRNKGLSLTATYYFFKK